MRPDPFGSAYDVLFTIEISYAAGGLTKDIQSRLRMYGGPALRKFANYIPQVDIGGGAQGGFVWCPPDKIVGSPIVTVLAFGQASMGQGGSYNTPWRYTLPGQSPPQDSKGFFGQVRVEERWKWNLSDLSFTRDGAYVQGGAGFRWGRSTYSGNFAFQLF